MPNFTQTQGRDWTATTNPLRKWLMGQPLSVTQSTVARDLGISRNYLSELMGENGKKPSLTLAVKIEKMTYGRVKVEDFVEVAA